MTRLAPAKLNLGLHVLNRRLDGFHQLETVFLPIGWADELTAESAPRLDLTTSDPTLPTNKNNLVVKAALELADHVGIKPTGQLHLDKRVPYGAGLGSGSSDAAAALRLCAKLWDVEVSEADFHQLAISLGSDVPFFLLDSAAHATGRGEVLAPLRSSDGTPYQCPFWIVVAVPPVHVSTAEAYDLVQPSDVDRPDLVALVRSNDLASWRAGLVNDFEAPIAARHPEIASALATLRETAGYVALSGSGSAAFGVFENETSARDMARALGDMRVWVQAPATQV